MTLLIAILLLEHGQWITLNVSYMGLNDVIILSGVLVLWAVHLTTHFVSFL